MTNRRNLLVLSAAGSLLTVVRARALASFARPHMAHLETCLFNFKSEFTPDQTIAAITELKARAAAAGLVGFMLGRNAILQQFSTRFEWIYMAQRDAATTAAFNVAQDQFKLAADKLGPLMPRPSDLRSELSTACRAWKRTGCEGAAHGHV